MDQFWFRLCYLLHFYLSIFSNLIYNSRFRWICLFQLYVFYLGLWLWILHCFSRLSHKLFIYYSFIIRDDLILLLILQLSYKIYITISLILLKFIHYYFINFKQLMLNYFNYLDHYVNAMLSYKYGIIYLSILFI